ncbi:D-tyrosyl-tRNA(Tyr) deacylase [Alkaliphilus metalliredigens QYMF]|uniref:D-aminoacyl-tRNA deacylase n=1 Tax=Alkaliphilus metalliredigens (strain QYMF) TaxID=293826 RepID=DTD_ALKMQ|nr:D-aminoacyl-tRNA deacylase [Alkaliphilus metalliredigens]A6TQP0.1 RecName: Full=D-aminoacyl-tRNA deacylase; Short=DTD; AltName: Full=Gly-tRNA(Ala) deacylase [Alkaliphilus metalliredigens QYMF]ABR48508.1 D-tyrosyl-tRNA(Tyr) deacylase [Alkaliphilus metalliredigens QYMF]
MRAVVQRIKEGKVTVEGEITGECNFGLLVYLGVGREDTVEDAKYLAEKIVNLRIFEDQEEKLNLSVKDVGGSLLVISQFTLFGDCRKGRRPSFSEAAKPDEADYLYQEFVRCCNDVGMTVGTGVFQAHMMVHAINDGPVTMLIDSKKTF